MSAAGRRSATASAPVAPGASGSDVERYLEAIESFGRELNRSREVGAIGSALAREIHALLPFDGLRFYVLQPDGETLEAVTLDGRVPAYADEDPDLVRLRLGEGLGGTIATTGEAEIIPDVLRDPRMQDIPGSEDIDESMLVVPLVFDERVLGVLQLSRVGLDRFTPEDLRLSRILGAQAAVALANAQHLAELDRRSEHLERQLQSRRQLLAVTERLVHARGRQASFEVIADTLAEVVPYDALTIYLVDADAGELVAAFSRDPSAESIVGRRFSIAEGITGDVVRRGEAELVNDANTDPRAYFVPGTPQEDEESLIVAPLHAPGGVIGTLNLYRIDRRFEPDDLEVARLYANHAAIALDNAQAHERLVEAARTDPLTGLANRAVLLDSALHALVRQPRTGATVALLFVDLDGFKQINDRFGHGAGDEVLRAVSSRFAESLRAADIAARLGGDEFGVLLEGPPDLADPAPMAERLRAAIARPFPVNGTEAAIRASIGVCIARPEWRFDVKRLIHDADVAMYRAKADGGDRWVLAPPPAAPPEEDAEGASRR